MLQNSSISTVLNNVATQQTNKIDYFLRGRKWAFMCEFCDMSFSSEQDCEVHEDIKHKLPAEDDWEVVEYKE